MKSVQDAFEIYQKVAHKFINPSKITLEKVEHGFLRKGTPEQNLGAALLGKNLHTFKKIKEFLQSQEYEEAFVLMRLVLERIALTFRMLEEHLPREAFEKLRAPDCLPNLKRQFEDLEKIYGFFSKVAGVDAYQFTIFYLLFKGKKDIYKFRNIQRKKLIILTNILFCVLTQVNLAVIEFLAKDTIDGIISWKYVESRFWKYSPLNRQTIPGLESWDVSLALKGYL